MVSGSREWSVVTSLRPRKARSYLLSSLYAEKILRGVRAGRRRERLEFHGRYWFTCKIVSQRY